MKMNTANTAAAAARPAVSPNMERLGRPLNRTEASRYIGNLSAVRNARLFVLNTSDLPNPVTKKSMRPKGSVIIRIVTANGREETVVVPNTWIPWELTARLPLKDLLDSSDLRREINNGALQILTEADAEELLSSSDAQEENNRVYMIVNRLFDEQPNFSAPEMSSGAPEDGISPIVVETMNREDIDDANRYQTLRNNINQLTEADFKYVLSVSRDERITKLASERIKALS